MSLRGTHARTWLLVPVLLATGCATSAHQAEEERVSPPTHSINTVADAKEFERPALRKFDYAERSSFPAVGGCWGYRC